MWPYGPRKADYRVETLETRVQRMLKIAFKIICYQKVNKGQYTRGVYPILMCFSNIYPLIGFG